MKVGLKQILMRQKSLILVFLGTVLIFSCSKKNHPSRTPDENSNTSVTVTKSDSAVAKKPAFKRKEKVVVPKIITVNDSAAHKSVDGRLYYDVLGHRYWRNNKDGKYYLFNKSMFTDDAFKPQGK